MEGRPWTVDAACDGMCNDFVFLGQTWTFPTQREHLQSCLDICAACPVKLECADWILLTDEPTRCAVVGGMNPSEIVQRRNHPDMIDARRFLNRHTCGTEPAYNTHLYFGEDCQVCRDGHARRTAQAAA
jgi:Transcription factor WhiB